MRFEFKYLVPLAQYESLKGALLPFLKRDPFAAQQENGLYTVRSIYFDSPGFEMYHTKVEGIAHRMKVRLRGYNIGDDHSKVFMEIKRKYEGPILKNRSHTSFGVVKQLFNGADFETLADQIFNPDNARRFFYQILRNNLQPVVNVIYEREPFLGNTVDIENDFRCTFDLHLRGVAYPKVGELYIEKDVHFAFPGFFILEVKFNRYCPAWIKPVLEDFKLRKEPASKYVGAINASGFINVARRHDVFAKSALLESYLDEPLPM
ncbi:MAG: polyphosphate polymerase domain-containing protein [Saprospiraceae bacterium]|nr:polyphosphate polymerase domain-containing protein [Saprospiraceae bacterium]